MASLDQLGMKAHGLAIEPLLYHGLPNPETIETMLAEIDEQLADNNKQ